MKHFSFLLLALLPFLSFSQLNIDSVGHVNFTALHDTGLNDIWGYVDEDNNEYALVGAIKGTSVVDVTNPATASEVFWEPGMQSIWRDLKTYGDYAYVTTEAQNGLLIIDLSPLPTSTSLTTNYYFGPSADSWESAHNLYIDSAGYCYIFGANRGNGGVIILDVATDPMNPIEVGVFDDWYVHDGYVLGDTMYLAHISDGFISIVDITDRSNPILLGTKETPNAFAHNIWTSADGQYAYTTDELP
ncbi:MAG: choice-of-anchor B family protein, partial [Crocinitomicaceae bacterium]